MIIYTVKQGDTLENIANENGVTVEQILNTNFPPNPDNLVVGQKLVILVPEVEYIVEEGDTLDSIAQKFNTSAIDILQKNPSIENAQIYTGQNLVIEYENGQDKRFIATNGYTYSNIDRQLLLRTLPYLTFLTIFTYGFTDEGVLIEPDDTELIKIARDYGVAPVMLISTLTEQGTFSNVLAKTLLEDNVLQQVLIENIITIMEQKGYMALDIDFEYLPIENRDNYIEFVSNLTRQLNDKGFLSLVALAPKTSVNQPGLLYESHDYRGLGEAANLVLLMTYEWGYTYGPPMAVSPIDKVEEVVRFGVSQINSQKILMGIPLYGYDWTLPFVRGNTGAKSLSPQQALEIASENNVTIEYDEVAQAPYFYYTKDGNSHVVWFEDADSVMAKLNLIDKYNLVGASYWNITKDFPQNWLVLISLYKVVKLL